MATSGSGSSPPPVVFAFLLLLLGLGLLVWGFLELRRKRIIEDTPTSKVRSMAIGLVELHARGFVSDGQPLQGPFSAAPCCWYDYKVEEYRQQGKNSHWVTLLHESFPPEVWVGDDTGEVLVRLAKAELDMPKTFELESGWGKDPPHRVQEFLDQHHTAWRGWVFNKKMRYTERTMPPGVDVYVLGTAQLADVPPKGGPATARTDVVLAKAAGPLLLSTHDERQLDRRYAMRAAGAMGLGGLATLGALLWLLGGVL